jgi:hypothetical protein
LPEERYGELFRAAETLWRAGITDENQIIPTLVFAARSSSASTSTSSGP